MAGHSKSKSTGKPLDEVLQDSQDVAAEVQSASDDLAIVHTVLEQELPRDVQVGEVAQAIEHTENLEKKLAESADKLAEANEALAQEVRKRGQAPHRLNDAQSRANQAS